MQAESDFKIRLSEAEGGNLRNAIPRESYSIILVPSGITSEFEKFVKGYDKMYRAEFAETEPDLSFTCEKVATPEKVMNADDQFKIIRAIFVCPNGVVRMSQAMKGLVETSNNVAIVKCVNGKFEAYSLCRSSVDSAKEATAWKIAAAFQLIDADIKLEGGYPGWKPNVNSPILKTMSKVYKDMFGKVPDIKAIHAGLECGLYIPISI
jgi:dipeptidase D